MTKYNNIYEKISISKKNYFIQINDISIDWKHAWKRIIPAAQRLTDGKTDFKYSFTYSLFCK